MPVLSDSKPPPKVIDLIKISDDDDDDDDVHLPVLSRNVPRSQALPSSSAHARKRSIQSSTFCDLTADSPEPDSDHESQSLHTSKRPKHVSSYSYTSPARQGYSASRSARPVQALETSPSSYAAAHRDYAALDPETRPLPQVQPFSKSQTHPQGISDQSSPRLSCTRDLDGYNTTSRTLSDPHPPRHSLATERYTQQPQSESNLASATKSSPTPTDRKAPVLSDDPAPVLCKEQADLVDIILSGRNVFYTGSAGCGKSTVLKAFVRRLRDRGKTVNIVAPTGRAALDIGGSTFWTYAGLTPDSLKRPLKKLIENATRPFVRKRLQETDVLVIDEVSMIENFNFERLNQLLRVARERKHLAFGGLQLVVTGDFCQLPPVKPFQFCLDCGREMRKSADESEHKCHAHGVSHDREKWAFYSKAWDECNFHYCHLKQIHRQVDRTFIEILQKLRLGGTLTQVDRDTLLDHPCETSDAVKLFPTVAEVKRTNEIELAKLKTPARIYDCLDTFRWNSEKHPHLKSKSNRSSDGSLEALRESRLDVRAELKVGMLVVLLVNLSLPDGLVNGSQGRVVRFEAQTPDNMPMSHATLYSRQKVKDPREVVIPAGVQLLTGEYATIREAQIAEFIRRARVSEWPVVRFDNGKEVTVYADCRPNALGDELEFSLLMRTQIPLVSGYALTIHKSQGMTLNRVIVDLARNFEQGMAYVALSRARTLDGLKVLNLPIAGLRGNEQVRWFLEVKCGFGR